MTPASTINKASAAKNVRTHLQVAPGPAMADLSIVTGLSMELAKRAPHTHTHTRGAGERGTLHSHTHPWGRRKGHPTLTDTHTRKGWEGRDDTCACSLHPCPCRMLRSNLISCVSNDTFAGLSSVRLLSLYDNRITTITPGAFTTLVSLSTM